MILKHHLLRLSIFHYYLIHLFGILELSREEYTSVFQTKKYKLNKKI